MDGRRAKRGLLARLARAHTSVRSRSENRRSGQEQRPSTGEVSTGRTALPSTHQPRTRVLRRGSGRSDSVPAVVTDVDLHMNDPGPGRGKQLPSGRTGTGNRPCGCRNRSVLSPTTPAAIDDRRREPRLLIIPVGDDTRVREPVVAATRLTTSNVRRRRRVSQVGETRGTNGKACSRTHPIRVSWLMSPTAPRKVTQTGHLYSAPDAADVRQRICGRSSVSAAVECALRTLGRLRSWWVVTAALLAALAMAAHASASVWYRRGLPCTRHRHRPAPRAARRLSIPRPGSWSYSEDLSRPA